MQIVQSVRIKPCTNYANCTKCAKCAHKTLYKVCKLQIEQSVRIKPNGVELPQPCSGQPGGNCSVVSEFEVHEISFGDLSIQKLFDY